MQHLPQVWLCCGSVPVVPPNGSRLRLSPPTWTMPAPRCFARAAKLWQSIRGSPSVRCFPPHAARLRRTLRRQMRKKRQLHPLWNSTSSKCSAPSMGRPCGASSRKLKASRALFAVVKKSANGPCAALKAARLSLKRATSAVSFHCRSRWPPSLLPLVLVRLPASAAHLSLQRHRKLLHQPPEQLLPPNRPQANATGFGAA